ncbi:hypothetical protein [Alkalicoccus luteus]|uniref:Uncharacterized protein n=1 Tax=Alkalicoccus luteus TaxID=1237094 RepID=A0A969PP30_9BACI|nr:hypothetical protein [Alkalicoccus luteus]NJP37775.1 hypothetical protein [Alkalicoccus luteus]
MFRKLRTLFGGRRCEFCGKASSEAQRYEDETGRPIHVCFQCVPYAERRGYPKR